MLIIPNHRGYQLSPPPHERLMQPALASQRKTYGLKMTEKILVIIISVVLSIAVIWLVGPYGIIWGAF